MQSVCESVLYGLPHVLLPTTCWKLDWEVLESNQQYFNALCISLQERVSIYSEPSHLYYVLTLQGMMLLACAEQPSSSSSSSSSVVRPHFLLLPSPSFTLLIKSVAVSELLLPADLPAAGEGERPTLLAQENLTHALEQVLTLNHRYILIFIVITYTVEPR